MQTCNYIRNQSRTSKNEQKTWVFNTLDRRDHAPCSDLIANIYSLTS